MKFERLAFALSAALALGSLEVFARPPTSTRPITLTVAAARDRKIVQERQWNPRASRKKRQDGGDTASCPA